MVINTMDTLLLGPLQLMLEGYVAHGILIYSNDLFVLYKVHLKYITLYFCQKIMLNSV